MARKASESTGDDEEWTSLSASHSDSTSNISSSSISSSSTSSYSYSDMPYPSRPPSSIARPTAAPPPEGKLAAAAAEGSGKNGAVSSLLSMRRKAPTSTVLVMREGGGGGESVEGERGGTRGAERRRRINFDQDGLHLYSLGHDLCRIIGIFLVASILSSSSSSSSSSSFYFSSSEHLSLHLLLFTTLAFFLLERPLSSPSSSSSLLPRQKQIWEGAREGGKADIPPHLLLFLPSLLLSKDKRQRHRAIRLVKYGGMIALCLYLWIEGIRCLGPLRAVLVDFADLSFLRHLVRREAPLSARWESILFSLAALLLLLVFPLSLPLSLPSSLPSSSLGLLAVLLAAGTTYERQRLTEDLAAELGGLHRLLSLSLLLTSALLLLPSLALDWCWRKGGKEGGREGDVSWAWAIGRTVGAAAMGPVLQLYLETVSSNEWVLPPPPPSSFMKRGKLVAALVCALLLSRWLQAGEEASCLSLFSSLLFLLFLGLTHCCPPFVSSTTTTDIPSTPSLSPFLPSSFIPTRLWTQKETRHAFLFLCLSLTMMGAELVVGVLSNSLGGWEGGRDCEDKEEKEGEGGAMGWAYQ
ncbi:hypothetical protein VYU27_007941 [Nannochloropsis oceanica]